MARREGKGKGKGGKGEEAGESAQAGWTTGGAGSVDRARLLFAGRCVGADLRMHGP